MTEHDLYHLALSELTKAYKIPFRTYIDDAGELAHELYDHEPDGGSPLPDGVVTPDTLSAKIAEVRVSEAWRMLREKRDQLIAETDWWAMSDRTMTAEQTAYRQALRDLPANTEDPLNPVWPTKP